MSDQRDMAEKIRVSVTLQRAHMDTFEHLIDEGRYIDPQDAIRDAIRIFFRLQGLDPWRFSARARAQGKYLVCTG